MEEKESRIRNLGEITYSLSITPIFPAKIRKMSKRRRKIALQRKLEKEIRLFMSKRQEGVVWEEVTYYPEHLANILSGKIELIKEGTC